MVYLFAYISVIPLTALGIGHITVNKIIKNRCSYGMWHRQLGTHQTFRLFIAIGA